MCFIFQNFQNGCYFELATNFFTGSYTGSWIYQKDTHEHFRHFELIDALAQILTEIYKFQILTNFVTWWRHRCGHECVKHNLHSWTSPTMYLQNIVCVAPVLHMIKIQTNKNTGWKHYHLANAGNKHFPRYWPFVWGIHRSPVNSPHKGQWRRALIFSFICA